MFVMMIRYLFMLTHRKETTLFLECLKSLIHCTNTFVSFPVQQAPHYLMIKVSLVFSSVWLWVYLYYCRNAQKAVSALLDACKSTTTTTATTTDEHEPGAKPFKQDDKDTVDGVHNVLVDGGNNAPHDFQEPSPPQSHEEDERVKDATKGPNPFMDETRSEASQGDVGK